MKFHLIILNKFFLFILISKSKELLETLPDELCTNTSADSAKSCYLLDPVNTSNICSYYHVFTKTTSTGLENILDYSKCIEIPFTKEAVNNIIQKEKNLYKKEEKTEIISFGLASYGKNLCSEYSFKDAKRDSKKTENYCKQSYVNFAGNKCCFIHIDVDFFLSSKAQENRCIEVPNEKVAQEAIDYIKNEINKQGGFIDRINFKCYDVEEVKYIEDLSLNNNNGGEFFGNKYFDIYFLLILLYLL